MSSTKTFGDIVFDFQSHKIPIHLKLSKRIVDILYSVEWEYQPKTKEENGKSIIEIIGCGHYGCAFFSNNNKIIKVTDDHEEALSVLKYTVQAKNLYDVFIPVHKVYMSLETTILWKDYANFFPLSEEDGEFLSNILDQVTDEYEEWHLIKDTDAKMEKIIDFARRIRKLYQEYQIICTDIKPENIGLYRKKLCIFDIGYVEFGRNWSSDEELENYLKIMNSLEDKNEIIDIGELRNEVWG